MENQKNKNITVAAGYTPYSSLSCYMLCRNKWKLNKTKLPSHSRYTSVHILTVSFNIINKKWWLRIIVVRNDLVIIVWFRWRKVGVLRLWWWYANYHDFLVNLQWWDESVCGVISWCLMLVINGGKHDGRSTCYNERCEILSCGRVL